MYVNLLRTGVGVDSIDHLYELQEFRRTSPDSNGFAFLTTRNTPTRANDLINGGSVYWIIRQQICVRQIIADIQTHKDEDGRSFCLVLLDPALILTNPVPHRHIQGWRYLAPEKAPADLRPFEPHQQTDDIDPRLAKDLAAAGLL